MLEQYYKDIGLIKEDNTKGNCVGILGDGF